MKQHTGLHRIGRETFLQGILTDIEKRGYRKLTLRENGDITPQQLLDFLRLHKLTFRRNGLTFEVIREFEEAQ